MDKYAVLTVDASDDFGEEMEDMDCLVISFQSPHIEEATKVYEENKGKLSNTYLVEVLDQEECT